MDEILRAAAGSSLIATTMWNCPAHSSLLLPIGDDHVAVKCESSSSAAGSSAGFDGMLAADYGHLCHHMSTLQNLPAPPLFATRSSESYFGMGDGSVYGGGDGRPAAFMHFGYTQTQPPTAATHPVRWTAAGGQTMVSDGSSFSGSKRRKTATTAHGPHGRLQGSSAKPRNNTAAAKAPCKRSQKLGDKITALQQLVSPYGKTDTASVLHEAAACIRSLHDQIQILAAPYPGESSSSPSSSQDAGEEPATGLRRRGLCVAPLSPAVASLVSGAARDHGRAHADVGGAWFTAL
ncbi:transcription factor bHLH110-like isoform X2 [Hordeum vulgare subsp. vulgare]|uniref:transcription factor bHLH110-like isoform X2 n=1 Tax=Hordeum vulgare subsp. vulgare TaxID=112509 RepID=UPI001D1A3319|nr:transcription factor bHLH110-like isoform X2 [Hordeum vulgare subsp. vulgare]